MLTFESILDSVRTVSILEVVGRFLSLKRKGKDYWTICPFHEDHSPSLSVSVGRNMYKCFACGHGGDAIHFVQHTTPNLEVSYTITD